jgi:hypothetical protein
MFRPFLTVVFASLLLAPVATRSQQAAAPAAAASNANPAAPVRDPQAVAVIAQTLAATGGASAFAAIQDFTAAGQITYFWAGTETTGSATLRGRGPDQIRLDANLPEGIHSWAVTETKGAIKKPDGSTKSIQYANSVNLGGMTFPQLRLAAALADPSCSISLAGAASLNGRSVTIVQIQRVFPADQDPSGDLTKLNTKSYLIDSQSFVIVATRDTLYSDDGRMLPTTHELEFSNFTRTNGVEVPFSVTEKIGGQQTWSLQLSSIAFNGGLAASLFQF